MITDSNQAAFDSAKGSGECLREAREKAGLTIEEAASRLHVPIHVVRALEQEDWQRLGAPVFVRGQLKSYARLLHVDLGPVLQERVAPIEPAKLVSHTHTPRARRMFESVARRAVYVVITAVLAIPVWYATRGHFGDPVLSTASLDVLPDAVQASPQLEPSVERPSATPAAAARKPVAPYVASLTPMPRADADGAGTGTTGDGLRMRFTGDSWIQVSGRDGGTIEQALVRSGEERSYPAGQVGRVVLGNASAVEVQQAGSTVDTAAFRRANVARFAVSSDGSVVPASN